MKTESAKFHLIANTMLYQQSPQQAVGLIVNGPDTPADTLTLAQALANDTVFFLLFDKPLPAGNADLLQVYLNLKPLFDKPAFPDMRMAWVAGADTHAPELAFKLRIKKSADRWLLPETIQLNSISPNNLAAILLKDSRVTAGELRLSIEPPAGEKHRFKVSEPTTGIDVIKDCEGAADLTLLVKETPSESSADSNAIQAGVIQLGPLQYDGVDVEALQVGQRFFLDPEDHSGWLESIRFGPFALTPAQQLQLTPNLDLWRPLNQARSKMQLTSGSTVASYYRTPVGTQLHLTPMSGAKLAFYLNPSVSPDPGAESIDDGSYLYLCPVGPFAVSVPNSSESNTAGLYSKQVIAGSSAIEYFAADLDGKELVLNFTANGDAYVPRLPAPGGSDNNNKNSKPRFGQPEDFALTSWCIVTGTEGAANYHAQPESNPLYKLEQTSIAGNGLPSTQSRPTVFLPFISPVAGRIDDCTETLSGGTGQDTEQAAFPMIAIGGLFDAEQIATAMDFDQQVFVPIRRQNIALAATQATNVDEELSWATSPQGLLLQRQGAKWQQLQLANALTDPNLAEDGILKLYNVRDDLQKSLLNNQLFLAISDQEALTGNADLLYKLTADHLQELIDADKLPQALADKIKALIDQQWIGEAAFYDVLKQTLGDADAADWAQRIYARTVQFSLKLAGTTGQDAWPFNLSPYSWSAFGTVLLFKFLPQSLESIIDDTSSWTAADTFNTSTDSVSQSLAKLIAESKDIENPELKRFYTEIASNPNWNGILAINTEVPTSSMPEELKGLAAGIDASEFKAHHIAISITKLDLAASAGEQPVTDPTNIDALINYRDPEPNAPAAEPYDYRVNSLEVIIHQSQLHGFSSQVALYINSLFGDGARITEGRYIQLDGSYQSQADGGTYIFLSESENDFEMSSEILNAIALSRAQFVTLKTDPNAGADEHAQIHTQFLLAGTIDFKKLIGFDAFSFGGNGGLSFSSLTLDMSFRINIPAYKQFTFNASPAVLDTSRSQARDNSLYQNFPIKLTALRAGTDSDRPDKNDYMAVGAPITSNGLSSSWYGLEYLLNLGSPGALAAKMDFRAKLMVAWSPGLGESPNAFIGLALPGVKGGERSMSLQGVIKLTFGDVRFNISSQDDRTEYVLQLRKIALSILGVKLPSSASIDLLLFGDSAGGNRNTIGWYASYKSAAFDSTTNSSAQLSHTAYPRLEKEQSFRLPQE